MIHVLGSRDFYDRFIFERNLEFRSYGIVQRSVGKVFAVLPSSNVRYQVKRGQLEVNLRSTWGHFVSNFQENYQIGMRSSGEKIRAWRMGKILGSI